MLSCCRPGVQAHSSDRRAGRTESSTHGAEQAAGGPAAGGGCAYRRVCAHSRPSADPAGPLCWRGQAEPGNSTAAPAAGQPAASVGAAWRGATPFAGAAREVGRAGGVAGRWGCGATRQPGGGSCAQAVQRRPGRSPRPGRVGRAGQAGVVLPVFKLAGQVRHGAAGQQDSGGGVERGKGSCHHRQCRGTTVRL